MATQITMGPVLFNWSPETWRDFYFRVADEAPVDTVYIGEVICSKREPFFAPLYDAVAARLRKGGKKVVFSTIAEIMLPRERKIVADLCATAKAEVEANDAAALYHLRGKPHRVGPFVNVYNEATMAALAKRGATHVTLPVEMNRDAIAVMAKAAPKLGVTIETMVYGRMPLALSARCYHARAHGRIKDNCQFVCNEDPNGMELKTVTGQKFLVVNGVQTMSYPYLNLLGELEDMQSLGVNAFRLSPHTHDMVEVAKLFRAVADGKQSAAEASRWLWDMAPDAEMANGFYHHKPGYQWSPSDAA